MTRLLKPTARTLLWSSLWTLLWTLPAMAQVQQPTVDGARPLEQTSEFWREIRQPGYQRARRLVEQGIAFMMLSRDDAMLAEAHLRSAILRFGQALVSNPSDPEALFLSGYALARFEIEDIDTGEKTRRDDEAIAAFEQLIAIEPRYRAEEVGFELGLLYSRVGDNARSIEAYERSIRFALSENQTAITHSNLAETRMQSGDLLGAVRDYETAIAIAQRANASPSTLGLPLFGLAVALDRLGEQTEALVRARSAVSAAGGTLDHLHQGGVFFEPASEIHYYEALGHQALASQFVGAAAQRELIAAERSWSRYLQLATDDDAWRDLVVERRAQVSAQIRRPSSAPARPRGR